MTSRTTAGLLALFLLGCNGTGTDGEETGATDASWVVGPVFEGYYGFPVGETANVLYFVLHEDGAVDWGSTTECEAGEPVAFGTWTQTAADEVEIHSDADSWPGNPALDFIRLRRTDDCAMMEAFEVRTDGSLSPKGGHYYSRGVPCLSECDGSSMREIIACEGEVNPCD